MTGNVIIRKQTVRVKTGSEGDALVIRRELNHHLGFGFISMLERIFSYDIPDDEYISIDHLKLDLGRISPEDMSNSFLRLIEGKLIEELKKKLQGFNNYQYPSGESGLKNRGMEGFPDQSQPVVFSSGRMQELMALYYFLEKGSYPWWYKKEMQKAPSALLEGLQGNETEHLVARIAAGKNKRVIGRLFIHLHESKYEAFISILQSIFSDSNVLQDMRAILENREDILQLFSLTTKKLYYYLFLFYILERSDKAPNLAFANGIYHFLELVMQSEKTSLEKLKENLQKNDGSKKRFSVELGNIFTRLASTDRTAGKDNISSASQPAKSENDNKIKDSQEAGTEGNVRDENGNTGSEPSKDSTRHPQYLSDEGAYINNAGLILLHPFLAAYFKEAGLLNDKIEFVSTEARSRAAVLLYYLQSGEEDYREWEMVLNKILCGIDPEEVIPEGIMVSEQEKQVSEELLQAVVNYWDALKGASTEALRNTFIAREGKVRWKEDHWLIQVERTGVDILLDRLPWGFGTIKLPWLNSLIYTEW